MSNGSQSNDPFTSGWMEEGLYYRGEAPPQGPDWDDDDWVYLPHENYIPISKSRVIKAMEGELGTLFGKEAYTHFIELLEGVYHFHYHKVLNELKEDYEYFSPSLGEQMRVGVDSGELHQREQQFLINFIHLMIRGNFNSLGEAEYTQADQHSYLLDLPIDVNWKIKDPEMYQRLFNYSATEEGQRSIEDRLGVDNLTRFLDLPQAFDQRIMIFHRGIEPDRTEGLFFMQKVNRIFDKFFELILKPFQKGVNTVTEKTEDLVEGTLEHGKNLLSGRPFAPRALAQEEGHTSAGVEIADSVVFLPRWLRRTSLDNQRFSLKNLFTSSLLQEPAIERVICVFRQYPPSPPPFLKKIPILGRFINMPEPDSKDPTIHVKLFQHIPLTDLEIIFPEKRIKMKPLDKFMLIFLGLIGLIVGIAKGMGGESGKSFLPVFFSVLLLLAIKTVTRFLNTRRKYMLQMSQDLYLPPEVIGYLRLTPDGKGILEGVRQQFARMMDRMAPRSKKIAKFFGECAEHYIAEPFEESDSEEEDSDVEDELIETRQENEMQQTEHWQKSRDGDVKVKEQPPRDIQRELQRKIYEKKTTQKQFSNESPQKVNSGQVQPSCSDRKVEEVVRGRLSAIARVGDDLEASRITWGQSNDDLQSSVVEFHSDQYLEQFKSMPACLTDGGIASRSNPVDEIQLMRQTIREEADYVRWDTENICRRDGFTAATFEADLLHNVADPPKSDGWDIMKKFQNVDIDKLGDCFFLNTNPLGWNILHMCAFTCREHHLVQFIFQN